ncbi:MAG: pentapeptide repeat-containing protein, partial [Deltaproteobacteria bacterium]|nr:pentapeptide repeat-containing protein [Deltaproteobacteria bacterium]
MSRQDPDRRQVRRRVTRHASSADLPRLPRSLAIGLKTPVGKVVGQVRWIDTAELLLLTPGRVAETGDLPARIALSNAEFADVTLRVLQTEDPWSTVGGVIHVARWMPKDDDTKARLEAFMRQTNAIVFGVDYSHPRSTNERQLAATEAKKKEADREALKALRERLAGELGMATDRLASVMRRNRAWTLAAALAGIFLGALLGLLGNDFRVLRVLLWRLDPARAIELGVLEGAALAGEDFSGATIDLVKFRESRLVGASFRGAALDHADFTGADLRRADLRQAKLTDAVIVNASLAGARFAGANLRGAAIRGDLGGRTFAAHCSTPPPRGR